MRLLLLSLYSLTFFVTAPLWAAKAHPFGCESYLLANSHFNQWLSWLEQSNVGGWETPTTTIEIPYTNMQKPQHDVEVRALREIPELRKIFLQGNLVRYPIHPHKTAWVSTPPTKNGVLKVGDTVIQARYTASGSLVIQLGHNSAYSIKMGTNHIVPNREEQRGKSDKRQDFEDGWKMSRYLDWMEKKFREPMNFEILKEVMGFGVFTTDPSWGTRVLIDGVLVRDLSPLMDGFFYLPGFAMMKDGRRLAETSGQKFEEYFGAAYAEVLGRVKAQMLVYFGMQMENPHSQNSQLQFDDDFRPTGKVKIIDISDITVIDQLAAVLQKVWNPERESVEIPTSLWNRLEPNWDNSCYCLAHETMPLNSNIAPMGNLDGLAIPYETLKHWGVRHNVAYVREINRLLGLNIPESEANSVFESTPVQADPFGVRMTNRLLSPSGLAAFEKFHHIRASRNERAPIDRNSK